jgi:3-dehydroquinate synthase
MTPARAVVPPMSKTRKVPKRRLTKWELSRNDMGLYLIKRRRAWIALFAAVRSSMNEIDDNRSAGADYPIHFLDDFVKEGPPKLSSLVCNRKILLCVTPTVARLYGERVYSVLLLAGAATIDVVTLHVSERTKTAAEVLNVCAASQRAGLGRRDLLVSLGGGICSDITRVAAAWIRRGIGHICIPTTLIGQIDAAIGVKGGINLDSKKSYLGVFRAPEAVFIAPAFLSSLEPKSLRNGFAEAIKLAVSMDPALFKLIESHGAALIENRFAGSGSTGKHILQLCVDLTLRELKLDPFELGTLRRVLDFGHSFSPLIEGASDYTISHGEAVAIDIAISTSLSVELGITSVETFQRILCVMARMGLPLDNTLVDGELLVAALEAAAEHRGGKPNLVLSAEIGRANFITERTELPASLLNRALVRLRAETAAMQLNANRQASARLG